MCVCACVRVCVQFAGSPAAGCTSATSTKCTGQNGLDMAISVFSYLPVPVPADYSALDPPPSCPSSKGRRALRGNVLGRVYEVQAQSASSSAVPSPSTSPSRASGGGGLSTRELVFEEPEMYPVEKNWMRFETADGTPHYIRSLQPYMIMRDCGQSRPPELVSWEEHPVFRTATKRKGLAVHGGSNPVLLQVTGRVKLRMGSQ